MSGPLSSESGMERMEVLLSPWRGARGGAPEACRQTHESGAAALLNLQLALRVVR